MHVEILVRQVWVGDPQVMYPGFGPAWPRMVATCLLRAIDQVKCGWCS